MHKSGSGESVKRVHKTFPYVIIVMVELDWRPTALSTVFRPVVAIKPKKRWEESAPGPVVMLMASFLEMWARLPCHIVGCFECYPSYPGGGLCFHHLFTLICTNLPSSPRVILPERVTLFTARVSKYKLLAFTEAWAAALNWMWVNCADLRLHIYTNQDHLALSYCQDQLLILSWWDFSAIYCAICRE